MTFREATSADIKQLMIVRSAVQENVLSNPGLVTEKHYEEYLNHRGKGWVCEIDETIVGFSVADLRDHNIWALFVLPGYEHRGIGTKLQALMLDWYFGQTKQKVWLGTTPNSRAEAFYRKAGWKEAGMHWARERKFEMSLEDWTQLNLSSATNNR